MTASGNVSSPGASLLLGSPCSPMTREKYWASLSLCHSPNMWDLMIRENHSTSPAVCLLSATSRSCESMWTFLTDQYASNGTLDTTRNRAGDSLSKDTEKSFLF